MHRFFIPSDRCKPPDLFLTGREAHHALHVLRLRVSDSITVLDGAGHEFLCEIQKLDRDKATLNIIEKRDLAASPCRLTLLQALPKGKLMDSIVQKATELAAFRIVPLVTERVILRPDKKDAVRKTEKWRTIAIESIKQCGSPWLPQIEEPVSPEEFLARNEPFELPLLASLEGDAAHARNYFQNFQGKHGRSPNSICIWVGPEGDFAPKEIEAIKNGGALPITLGPHVLRTETAAIYGLSILNYELQTSRVNS